MTEAFDAVQDNGQRHTYSTGALRERTPGKGRFDLLPALPLLRLAQHFENGATKYADRNWEKGIPLSHYIDSAFRHLVKFMGGDRSEDHLAAILWNVFCFIHTQEMIRLGRLPADLADWPEEGPWSPPPATGTPQP
jgi:hypothetical protein